MAVLVCKVASMIDKKSDTSSSHDVELAAFIRVYHRACMGWKTLETTPPKVGTGVTVCCFWIPTMGMGDASECSFLDRIATKIQNEKYIFSMLYTFHSAMQRV